MVGLEYPPGRFLIGTTMLNTALDRFRLVAFAEGTSFLVLLGIAMPLKYLASMPAPVKVVGWIHGVLFILYVAALIHAAIERRWSTTFSVAAFVASLIPAGTFYLEYVLRRDLSQPTGDESREKKI